MSCQRSFSGKSGLSEAVPVSMFKVAKTASSPFQRLVGSKLRREQASRHQDSAWKIISRAGCLTLSELRHDARKVSAILCLAECPIELHDAPVL